MQQRQHHRQQRGFLATMQAAGRGEHAGRLARQRARQPFGDGAVEEVLHRRRHVAEAGRAAERQADALVQVAQFDIGRAVGGDVRRGGLAHRRDRRHRAQPRVGAGHAVDAGGDQFGELAGAAVTAVVEDQDVGHEGGRAGRNGTGVTLRATCAAARAAIRAWAHGHPMQGNRRIIVAGSAPAALEFVPHVPSESPVPQHQPSRALAPRMELAEAACAAALCRAARRRGPPAAGRGQPDLHDRAVGGAGADGRVRAARRVPDVRELSQRDRRLPVPEPDSRQSDRFDHRLSGAIRAQCQGPDRGRPGRPDGHRGADDADGRGRAQCDLARQAEAALRAARAGVLGGADVRPGADRRQPVDQLVPDLDLRRLCRHDAVRRRLCGQPRSGAAVGDRLRLALYGRAQRLCRMARCHSRGAGGGAGIRAVQARLRLFRHALPDLYRGLRCLRRAADLPAVDLPELAGDAARRHHRGQPAGGAAGLLAPPHLCR